MSRRKNLVPLFVLTLFSWVLLGYLTFNFPPESTIPISNFQFPIFNFFFPLFFLATFSSLSLFLNNARLGLLGSIGVVVFLILRLLKLTHPFYLVILLATLVALELTFRRS